MPLGNIFPCGSNVGTGTQARRQNYTAGAINLVKLGSPNPGWRWIVRTLAILPGPPNSIFDAAGAGVVAAFFVGGEPSALTLPSTTDWKWSLQTPPTTSAVQQQTFTSNVIQVQPRQQLMAALNSGANGYNYLVVASVIQVPNHGEKRVSNS